MDERTIIDILNELLTLEQRNLPRRLLESTIYVSGPDVADLDTVQRAARACREHGEWLAGAIHQCGGAVGLSVQDPNSADLHYHDLPSLWPRLVADIEERIKKYTIAVERMSDESEASDVIKRILSRHGELLALAERETDPG